MTKILGKSIATAYQMSQYLLSKNPEPKFTRNITALEFCQIFIDECAKEYVRGDIAFAQACKETGNFKYGGDVSYNQNNFAGIGATGNKNPGNIFDSIEIGVLAQAQHLKAYATKDGLNETNVDPRRTNWFMKTKGGTSPNVETLGGSWAVPGYDTKKYSSLEEANKAEDSYGYQIITILNNILKIEDKKDEIIKKFKVAVDAGHGSNTAGKRSPDGYREHWINVKCANFFNDIMTRCGIDTIKVAWDDTDSTNDVDVPLSTRQKQIKDAGCDISISWHANAHGDGIDFTSANGFEIFIHNNALKVGDSKTLANTVEKYLLQGTKQTNRGVKTKALSLCNCSLMGTKSSILVEVGFMTNEYEIGLMKTDKFCLECAEEVAQGVCEYLGVEYIQPSDNKPISSNTSMNTVPDNYTVLKGDTLSKIGSKVGVPWKTIASLNNIKSPYVIRVGQILKLKEDTKIPSTSKNKYMSNGIDYSLVFDPSYYAKIHADVKKACGTNETSLFAHFINYGMKEGRMAKSTFNVHAYRAKYADLRKAFGSDLRKYYKHYVTYGYKENRETL